jgi:hypothetical protein
MGPGLQLTEEERARDIAALVRERAGMEARLAGETNDERRLVLEADLAQVREQLAVRGAAADAPHRRAAKRDGRPGQEARA